MSSKWIPVIAAAAVLAVAPRVHAQDHTVKTPNDIQWGDAPPVLPKGAKMAVMFGDPSKSGLFIVRLKMPAKYKIMPHWHPSDENVTVLSGALAIGMGDAIDAKTKAQPVGSFFSLPAKMHHYAFTKKATVIEVAAMGPFAITYINPADDPSKAPAEPAKPEAAKTPPKKAN